MCAPEEDRHDSHDHRDSVGSHLRERVEEAQAARRRVLVKPVVDDRVPPDESVVVEDRVEQPAQSPYRQRAENDARRQSDAEL